MKYNTYFVADISEKQLKQNFYILQKQYIFIYRALMEVALYGDTEIIAADLKTTIDKLRQNGKNRCKMDEDFEVRYL